HPCQFNYPGKENCCLKPDCPCQALVPLVLVRPKPYVENKWAGYDKLEFDGRRYLPGPLHPCTLTHICDFNWPHAGSISRTKLEVDANGGSAGPPPTPQPAQQQQHAQQPAGEGQRQHGHHGHHEHHGQQKARLLRLVVVFDRPLMPDPRRPGQALRLDEQTFVVQYVLPGESDGKQRKQLHGRIVVVPCDNGASDPVALRRWTEVHFYMNPHECTVEAMLAIADPTLYVTLKCDFI